STSVTYGRLRRARLPGPVDGRVHPLLVDREEALPRHGACRHPPRRSDRGEPDIPLAAAHVRSHLPREGRLRREVAPAAARPLVARRDHGDLRPLVARGAGGAGGGSSSEPSSYDLAV